MPVITIQSRGRKHAIGWFSHERWLGARKERLAEINLCAEDLGRDAFEIAETLIHEMVHYANERAGVVDCSTNQYHNRKFRDRAESVGLQCERGPRGWAYTRLTPELRKKLEAIGIDSAPFRLFRVGNRRRHGSAAETKEPKHRRWECRCGPIRVGRERFHARCLYCGEEFMKSEMGVTTTQ